MTDLSDKTAEIKLLEPEQTALKPKSIKQDRQFVISKATVYILTTASHACQCAN